MARNYSVPCFTEEFQLSASNNTMGVWGVWYAKVPEEHMDEI